MLSENSWIAVLLFIFLAGVSQVYGTDIGYHCQSELECQTGNGGLYSRCNSLSSVCVCTHDYLGNENKAGLNKDDSKCKHINECNRIKGCNISCIQEDEDDLGCQTVIFCSSKANCTVGCAPRELWMWDANKDWYWTIPKPLVSDFIPEKKTSVCYDPDRAVHSFPEGMVIKTSDIPGAGLGVFTEKFLERGTLIGPYKGIRVYDGNFNEDWSWTIKATNGEWKVDARDKSLSNWVRYINNPKPHGSQNLAPICHEGEMYYFAFKSIQPGSELSVWYGDGFASKLGIKKDKRIRYAYGKDGFIGGRCLSKQFKAMYGVRCYIENAVCMTVVCLCKNGSHARGGECINGKTNVCGSEIEFIQL
ncbi:uncharacterized protein LOC123524384 [Mercenaria mercenaria]|uniref:uncharacterized protein LOC123524384 n=1 Tax=Mercenaria mercenaria TaxID=6596 RepID=UPI00234F9DB7|nr:uncharacterized protein LOC123524384 [Mercenaria mercenaria]